MASDRELRDWLLQRLPETRATEFEAQLFASDRFAERLRDAEYALLDDYARGRLDPDERAAARLRLLATPGDRARLGVARALARRAAPSAARPARGPRPRQFLAAALAAGLAAVAVALWPTLRQAPPAPATLALNADAPVIRLTAHVERGLAPLRVTLPAGVAGVRLQAEIEQPQPGERYLLSIADASGRERYAARDLEQRHAGVHVYVEAAVPAQALAPGRLQFSLRAQNGSQAPYSWTVEAVPAP